jgi:diacylglycerol kinase family enzyme
MKARLVYNQSAGMRHNITADDLVEALHQAGYDCVYTETDSEADLDPILADAEGLIVAAGGDGTVRAVVTRIIGQDVALAVVPLGTANNIGRTLGVEGRPLEIVAGLESPRQRPFDVGHVQSPWDEPYFLEALGYGFYADALAAYRPDEGKSILRHIIAVAETIVD